MRSWARLWRPRCALDDVGPSELHVPKILQAAPAAAPHETGGLGYGAEQGVTTRCTWVLLADDDASVDHEGTVRREPILVIALTGRRMRDMVPHADQFGLALRTAVSLQQHHVVTMLFLHQSVHRQQAIAKFRIEQFPSATCRRSRRAFALYLARQEKLGRQRRRWHQLFALQQRRHQWIGIAAGCVVIPVVGMPMTQPERH